MKTLLLITLLAATAAAAPTYTTRLTTNVVQVPIGPLRHTTNGPIRATHTLTNETLLFIRGGATQALILRHLGSAPTNTTTRATNNLPSHARPAKVTKP